MKKRNSWMTRDMQYFLDFVMSDEMDELIENDEREKFKISKTQLNEEQNRRENFRISLSKLYDITVNYKNALRNANKELIYKTTSELTFELQKLYDFSIRYKYSDAELANKAAEIVDQWNKYGKLYNAFIDSSDRMSEQAQAFAAEAEQLFAEMVDMIVKVLL